MFRKPASHVLVFTDLDGTLLDHDGYGFDEAVPAIRLLQSQHIPIIPATSKTVEEMLTINQALNNPNPFIAENGSIICFPKGYFEKLPPTEEYHNHQLIKLAPEYAEVCSVLTSLRNTESAEFIGFSDMSVDTVMKYTGLTMEQAIAAKNRLCSEPVIWQGCEKDLEKFKTDLAKAGMQLIKGGRFWHVLGKTNKAIAMRQLIILYNNNGLDSACTVALGDSPNDVDMLKQADTAIVIKRKDGTQLTYESSSNAIYSSKPGPAGWNETILAAFEKPGV